MLPWPAVQQVTCALEACYISRALLRNLMSAAQLLQAYNENVLCRWQQATSYL